jgi:ornithine cyclodeaminase/alanine dehydrogenase-like protein (mu-crystallin family)
MVEASTAVIRALDAVDERSLMIVNAAALERLVTMEEAVSLIDRAMRELSGGAIEAPERWGMSTGRGGRMVLMPGAQADGVGFGVKVLSLFDEEARGDFPGHQGVVILFDGRTGRPLVIADAAAITGLRTAAATAVATRALARSDSSSLALLGCGEQARFHVRALPLVRDIREVRLWAGRNRARAERFAEGHLGGFERVTLFDDVREVVKGADIVCTLTHSADPILEGKWLEPGQHLNLIGSSVVGAREVDDDAVARGRFIVDSRSHALSQAGELVHAMAAGTVTDSHIHAEIGEILEGTTSGRADEAEITIYKSLGHIVQDIAVASAASASGRREGVATRVDW